MNFRKYIREKLILMIYALVVSLILLPLQLEFKETRPQQIEVYKLCVIKSHCQ